MERVGKILGYIERPSNETDVVFVVYGAILTALGIFGSSHVKNKAAGLNIDLWAGIGMLVFAALMIAWALLRPVEPDPPEQRGKGSGRIRRSPAT